MGLTQAECTHSQYSPKHVHLYILPILFNEHYVHAVMLRITVYKHKYSYFALL